MKRGWKKGGAEVQGGLKFPPSVSFSKCVCALSKPLRRMPNCVCAKKPSNKKRRRCSLQNRRINIYTVARTICQTVGGSKGRGRWREGLPGLDIQAFSSEHLEVSAPPPPPPPPPPPLAEWARLSRTCAPVGFRLPRPGLSVHLGFCLCFPLEEACWYVSQSLAHSGVPRSLAQHAQVGSHLHA